jgi:hypothetical protein
MLSLGTRMADESRHPDDAMDNERSHVSFLA